MSKAPARQRLLTSVAGPDAAPTTPQPLAALRQTDADLAGQATSATALAKLHIAMQELRTLKVQPYLNRSVECLKANDATGGAKYALEALNEDEQCGFAWRLLGISREMSGDFGNAIRSYEAALELAPEDFDIANDIGRLALVLGMKEQAEKLFAHYWHARPELPDGANNFACVLRDQHRYEDAVEVLKVALGQHTDCAILWNTLGTVVSEMGDVPTAITFFDEALRLTPSFAKAQYNRGNAKLALLDFEGALEDCNAALALATPGAETVMMKMARSSILHCLGRLEEAWADYESRLDSLFAGSPHFLVDRPRWKAGDDLSGKSVLVMAEQGLGDEILFANVLEDVIGAVGPNGQVSVCVEKRLVSLFERSFPTVKVSAEGTFKYETHILKSPSNVDPATIDCWAPMGSFLTQYRASAEAFPKRDRFMQPDEKRVAHWRKQLGKLSSKPKVGILWKSMLLQGSRLKHFSPFEQWSPILKTPGVTFVNLQYGECGEELAWAKKELGVEVWNPPGIDLKQDLDDLAALCAAMDLVVGFSNATTNIAGSCGVPLWMIAARSSWTRLGFEEGYPWYPQTKMFDSPLNGDWSTTMSLIADELARAFPSH